MAKIFYVTETTPDYAQVNFFKTEKEALEYGASELEGFTMFDEPMNDEESMYDSESWYQGDSLTFKKGILFSWEGGEVYVQAMEEDAAREYVEELGEEGGAIFFDGFSRGMYGYLGTAADGKGFKWDWDGYDLNESTSNGGLKYVKLFEQFINEAVGNLSPDLQELLIAYYYAAEGTPEGDKFTEKIIELGLLDESDIRSAFMKICPNFEVRSIDGKFTKFRGDRRKALAHLAEFTNVGKVKVPSGDYPTATRFIMDMIIQNTGKNLRLEYKGGRGSAADLVEYNPEVVDQPSLNVIHPHPSDVVLIKDFTQSPIREVLDICIKEGWFKKPVYNW